MAPRLRPMWGAGVFWASFVVLFIAGLVMRKIGDARRGPRVGPMALPLWDRDAVDRDDLTSVVSADRDVDVLVSNGDANLSKKPENATD